MDAEQTAAAREFWVSFVELGPRLRELKSADDPVYDTVLHALQAVHAELYFEFGRGAGGWELIITPHGKRSLFPLVRELVAAAPAVEGWSILALKPKMGFPKTARWNDVAVRIEDVFVRIHRRPSGGFDLDLLVPGIADHQREDAHNALLNAMDHGVGEETLAENVIGTDLLPLGPGESTADLVRITDLADVLEGARGDTC